MKKFFLLFTWAVLLTSVGFSQTYRTITIDGNNDFVNGSERFSTTTTAGGQGAGYAYITWDATYLYIGFSGSSASGWLTDNDRRIVIYLDTDPKLVPTSGSGTTAAVNSGTYRFVPTLPFSANYNFGFATIDNGEIKRMWNGSAWVTATFETGNWKNTTTQYWEARIKRSDIGNPSKINLLAYVEETWSSGFISAGVPNNLFTDQNTNTTPALGNFLSLNLTTGQTPNASQWYLGLNVAGGSLTTSALAGMNGNATDGRDQGVDVELPPTPPSNYIEAYFPHEDWTSTLGTKYASDVKAYDALSASQSTWNFTVSTDVSGTITISPSLLGSVPSSHVIYLKDLTTGTRTNLRTGNYTYTANPSESTRNFTITIGAADPNASVDSTSLTYGELVVNNSLTKTVTLTNTGVTSLVVSSLAVSGTGYSLAHGSTLPRTLAQNDTLKFNVTFLPTTAGNYDGTVTIVTNDPDGDLTIAATGSARTLSSPSISSTPSSWNFGTVKTNDDSTKTFTIANGGEEDLEITAVSVSGDFFSLVTTVNLPVILTTGQSTTLDVKFDPAAAGSFTGTLKLISNDPSNDTLDVALSGTGQLLSPVISFSPGSVDFGSTGVDTDVYGTLTVSNTGDTTLTVSALTSTNSAFTVLTAAPLTIEPGNNATVNLKFRPAAVQAYSGKLVVASNDAGSPDSVNLTGEGIANSLSKAFPAGWSLMSVPLVPNSPLASAVIGDDVTDYLLYKYSGGEYTSSDSVNAGKGYWLGLQSSGTIDVDGTAKVTNDSTMLSGGWNMIANPFARKFAKSSVQFRKADSLVSANEAAARGWIQNVYYNYVTDSTKYSNYTDSLERWNGYFFLALQSSVYMVFDRNYVGSYSDRGPVKTETTPSNWYVNINAAINGAADQLLAFGVADNATDGFDALYDYAKPPISPAPNAAETYFLQSGWNQYITKFAADIKAPFTGQTAKSWSFRAMSKTGGSMTIEWANISSLPQEIKDNYTFMLRGPGIPNGINMLTQTSYTFTATAGAVYSFSINSTPVGVDDGTGQPVSYRLNQNFPNPFNPSTTISYSIAEPGVVTLKVFDAQGNEVASLVNEYKNSGSYSINFDASGLSSGVYFYKLQAGSFSETRKLMLMK